MAIDLDPSRDLEVVFKISVAEVTGKERPGQVRAVAVPIQQIEGGRGFPLHVVIDDVVPDELARAQEGKGGRQFAGGHEPARTQLAFTRLRMELVDEYIQYSCFLEVEQRRQ